MSETTPPSGPTSSPESQEPVPSFRMVRYQSQDGGRIDVVHEISEPGQVVGIQSDRPEDMLVTTENGHEYLVFALGDRKKLYDLTESSREGKIVGTTQHDFPPIITGYSWYPVEGHTPDSPVKRVEILSSRVEKSASRHDDDTSIYKGREFDEERQEASPIEKAEAVIAQLLRRRTQPIPGAASARRAQTAGVQPKSAKIAGSRLPFAERSKPALVSIDYKPERGGKIQTAWELTREGDVVDLALLDNRRALVHTKDTTYYVHGKYLDDLMRLSRRLDNDGWEFDSEADRPVAQVGKPLVIDGEPYGAKVTKIEVQNEKVDNAEELPNDSQKRGKDPFPEAERVERESTAAPVASSRFRPDRSYLSWRRENRADTFRELRRTRQIGRWALAKVANITDYAVSTYNWNPNLYGRLMDPEGARPAPSQTRPRPQALRSATAPTQVQPPRAGGQRLAGARSSSPNRPSRSGASTGTPEGVRLIGTRSDEEQAAQRLRRWMEEGVPKGDTETEEDEEERRAA
jgi:hypothetical protein